MNLWETPIIPFNEISGSHQGVVIKAALQSLQLSELGVGANATVSGTSFDFTRGGVFASTLADYIDYTLSAGQIERLSGQGRIQFEVLRDSILDIDTDDNVLAGFMTAANASTGAVIRLVKQASAKPSMWTTRQGALKVNAAWATGNGEAAAAQPLVVVTDDMPAWVTIVLSWDASFLWWSIFGETVCKARHAPSFGAVTKFRLSLDASTTANRVVLRNLILSEIPAPNTRDVSGSNIPRCAVIAHSFAVTAGGLPEDGFDTNEPVGSINQCMSNFHASYESKFGPLFFKNTGHDGWLAHLPGEGLAASTLQTDTESRVADSLTIKNRVHRWRPDICIVMVHNSNEPTGITEPPDGTSTLEVAIKGIFTNLITQGVIPVLVLEQNRDKGSLAQNRRLNNLAMGTLVNNLCNQYGPNYIGMVDCWSATGGESVNPIFVETSGALIHPNWHAGIVYGQLISNEVKRILDNPPSYARWANRNDALLK